MDVRTDAVRLRHRPTGTTGIDGCASGHTFVRDPDVDHIAQRTDREVTRDLIAHNCLDTVTRHAVAAEGLKCPASIGK